MECGGVFWVDSQGNEGYTGREPVNIFVQNRQRTIRFDVAWLRRVAVLARGKCVEICGDGRFALREMAEVEVAVVSDRVIARVHWDFMRVPGATDVITFEHGEIVMSAETAARFAGEHGHSVEEELALYTVHGLLHLNGFDDATSREAARMKRIQARVLKQCIAEFPIP